jgi:hypothetical protein
MVEAPEAVIVGIGTTVIPIVLVDEQPVALTPVTVYIVVIVGVTETTEPVSEPGSHV